jgi:hypothetical protein
MKQEPLLQDAPPAGVTGADVVKALAGYRLPVSNEKAMQDAVESALRAENLPFEREVKREADRIDFLVGGVVGVELKVKGAAGDVQRQLERYATWPEVTSLVLVTSKGAHRVLPRIVGGKPLLIHIPRGVF